MSSVSGLSAVHRIKARSLAVQAAKLGVANEPSIHYTQGASRWQGLDRRLKAYKGEYPSYADCSAFTTWCLWNGLSHYGCRDTVNGTNWTSGYTGTQRTHGKQVKHRASWLRGDLIHYGPGTGEHVAILVDAFRGLVVSHGSEAGPKLLRWNYRNDFAECRRYI